ncbi:tyrosine-type recombinase/integrase [Reyranella sp.]|uniref:tyrosine-type recombinase/integrase n=1 Tax=Reyranella sp. TaxID=1929291 RepID=UPI0027245DFB|nr:tyrosine-type recombinase/integrase [Reyranella sp.]MDO8973817.1 tyrosine-type recombinase/integrase [Reyranella sp.]
MYRRGGVLYARLAIATNQYQHRSLKTGNAEQATLTAQKLWTEFTVRRQLGLPVKQRTLNTVIDEYVALREKQHQQGRTSEHMLRQTHRVVKFWRKYAGTKQVSQIGDAEMSGYVDWRRDYYAGMTDDELPKNAKRNPTHKTLQWEIMLGKSIIKYAQQQGYRGAVPFPTFSFTPKTKRVRPAFSLVDYRKLWRALIKWERECEDPRHLHTRQLLRDYVLILANSGLRVGEANNLKRRDIDPFKDEHGRRNYRLIVRGKTGERDVIPRAITTKYIERLLARRPDIKADDWLFAMSDGSQVITLIDQFNVVLKLAGIERNSFNDKYTLYSLRHFYATQALNNNVPIYAVARNMGTSVKIIETYYGKGATALSMASMLGGKLRQ